MANPEYLAILHQGVKVWNRWREENPDIRPDFREARLDGLRLVKVNLTKTNLRRADLNRANLYKAVFDEAFLVGANLDEALDIIANNPIAQKVVELSSSQPDSLGEHSRYRLVFPPQGV